MATAVVPPDEERRLAGLHRLGLLDTPPEQRFDRLVELAALMLDAPMALITLIDRNRQWFKARVGIDLTETDRDIAFCAHAIVGNDALFVVPDALLDERFADNPFVTGEPGVRFYAGHVLRNREGLAMGALCAIDRRPRTFGTTEQQVLALLAELVEQELDREYQQLIIANLTTTGHQQSLILDTLTEGLILLGTDGRAKRWNPAAEHLLELTGDQLLGRCPMDDSWWMTQSDGSRWTSSVLPTVAAAITGEPIIGLQIGVHRPDGSIRWLRLNAHPVRESSDAMVSGVLTAMTDITAEVEARDEHLRLEAELRRSEETARISLDSLEQGVVLVDATGHIHRANPAAERMLGETAEELVARWRESDWTVFDLDGRAIAEEDRPVLRSLRRGEEILGETIAWTRLDGSRIALRLSCTPNVDGVGGVLVAMTDVTEEMRAQRLLDATLRTAPVGLAILDYTRRIVRCNPMFAQQAGRDIDELIGTDAVGLLEPMDQRKAGDIGAQLLDGRAPTGGMEHRVVRPDGTEIWIDTHLAVIPDLDRPLAIAATFDVTERRRMTRELSRFSYLFQHANDVIVVIDAAGTVQYASPSSQRVLGYPVGHRHPDGVLGLVHPDDIVGATAEFLALLDGSRGPQPFTVRIATFDGRWRYMECVGANLLDEPAVGGIVITARDATERVHLSQELAHRASHDPLTDLPNRAALDEFLIGALARAERTQRCVAVCFIDLDGFKAINDTMGHAAGDQLLVDVATEINRSLRRGDTAARIGGDEFVLVLDAVAGAAEAAAVAGRVRDAILTLAIGDDARGEFGASVGLALSEFGDTVDSVLKRADAALYRAKASHDSSIEVETERVADAASAVRDLQPESF